MALERPRAALDSERKVGGLVQPEQIPVLLKRYPQWVCWRYVDRGKDRKPDKQPVNPRTLANAGVHWANTWTTFDVAYATYLRHVRDYINGIGFVLTPEGMLQHVETTNVPAGPEKGCWSISLAE
jgi:primase-polymerase (primpol)-like protein